MKKREKYLTIEEKREFAFAGKRTPVCTSDSSSKESFIAKLRGSIFDGQLTNRRIKL